jgi:hypothetical protein
VTARRQLIPRPEPAIGDRDLVIQLGGQPPAAHGVDEQVHWVRRPAHAAPHSTWPGLARETLPVPEPGPGELLVEVRATAVTAGELAWLEGWPAIPCHDLSGVVAATGPEATGWQAGDEVYGLIGFDRPGAAAHTSRSPPPT